MYFHISIHICIDLYMCLVYSSACVDQLICFHTRQICQDHREAVRVGYSQKKWCAKISGLVMITSLDVERTTSQHEIISHILKHTVTRTY